MTLTGYRALSLSGLAESMNETCLLVNTPTAMRHLVADTLYGQREFIERPRGGDAVAGPRALWRRSLELAEMCFGCPPPGALRGSFGRSPGRAMWSRLLRRN